jgi:hypothetical protein
VLALFKPVDKGDPNGFWRAFDLNGKRLGMPDDYKYPLNPNTRKKILETPMAQALVQVVEMIKDAKDPKKLYEDVLEFIVSYIQT